MERRWCGILKVPLDPSSHHASAHCYKVAASLSFSPSSSTLLVPSANVIFFGGDRVEGTKNPVIERLSNLQNVAEILVSKLGASVNAWVVQAATFNGPFAVYKDFIPTVSKWGDPKAYNPVAFPASSSTVKLLENCLQQAKRALSDKQGGVVHTSSKLVSHPKTFLFGFSKGGTVLNQIVSELGSEELKSSQLMNPEPSGGSGEIIPRAKETFLNSIAEIHYVDVGLNAAGAYITDHNVIRRISKHIVDGGLDIRFVFHGTPRQWCDNERSWINKEKEVLIHLLESEARETGGRLRVSERLYFADRPPDMQMHFEVIKEMDIN